MEFNKFDLTLLVVMSMTIILLSFLMPAVGYADQANETAESDVPEFSMESSRFDFTGDFPDRPGSSGSGTLTYDEKQGSGITGVTQEWLDRPKDTGFVTELANYTDAPEGYPIALIATDFNGTGDVEEQAKYDISDKEGETIIYNKGDWVIEYKIQSVENAGEPNATAEVDYNVKENGGDNSGGGLSAVPVVGTLFDAGEQLASGLVWVGEIIWWTASFVFEIAINLIGILVDAMVFGIDLLSWMVGSYADVTTAAAGWASVILLVPTIILFGELVKLSMVAISLLPTT